MNKKIFIYIFLIMFIFTGCNEKHEDALGYNIIDIVSDDFKNTQATNEVLRLSIANPKTMNPLLNEDSRVNEILKLIYLPFVAIDGNDKVVPSVANMWTLSEDGLSATFLIKDDLYWDNGASVTADDVIYSYKTILNSPNDSCYKNVTNYVRNISRISSNTVKIDFNSKFGNNFLALDFPIIPNNTNLLTKTSIPVGNGAYKVSEHVEASHISLVPNTYYNGNTAQIPKIHVEITADYETDVHAFQQGMLDVLIASGVDLGKYDYNDKETVYQFPSNDYDFIGFNFTNPLFKEKYMRQAIAYAFPKQNILDTVYLGYGVMTHTPIHPQSWLYEENVAPYTFDSNMSSVLLKNNSWADVNNDKVLEKTVNGVTTNLEVTILINEESSARKQIATRFKDELSAIGFKVTIDSQPFNVYTEKFKTKDYDLVIGSWKMSKTLNLNDLLHTNGSLNYIGYSDSETDILLNTAYSATGEGEMILAYSRLQQRLAEEIPYISIAYTNNGLVVNNNIGGLINPRRENSFNSIELWN